MPPGSRDGVSIYLTQKMTADGEASLRRIELVPLIFRQARLLLNEHPRTDAPNFLPVGLRLNAANDQVRVSRLRWMKRAVLTSYCEAESSTLPGRGNFRLESGFGIDESHVDLLFCLDSVQIKAVHWIESK